MKQFNFGIDVTNLYSIFTDSILLGKEFTYRCIRLESGDDYIIKSSSKENSVRVKKEIEALSILDHPCIIHLVEIFEDRQSIHLIFQDIKGNPNPLSKLLQLQPDSRYNEKTASFIIGRIISTLRYMQSKNVSHRNLCLENILVCESSSEFDIMLTDFTSACVASTKTPTLNGLEGEGYDVFSIGVIAFSLVTGIRPTFSKGNEDLLCNRICGSVELQHLSDDCINFISTCLDNIGLPVNNIITLQNHSWLRNPVISPKVPLNAIMKLQIYQRKNKISRALILSLSHSLNSNQIINSRKIFLKFDRQNRGEISYLDFQETLRLSCVISENEIRKIFAAINVRNTDFLSYHEFIAAMISEEDITESNLQAAFGLLSCHQDFITVDDIRNIFGNSITVEDFERMFLDVGLSTYSLISYPQYINLLGLYRGDVTSVVNASSSDMNISDNNNAIVAEIEGVLAMAARRQLQCITENMVTEDCTAGLQAIYYIDPTAVLGSGVNGAVTKCRNKVSGKQYALKKMDKSQLSLKQINALRQEIRIMAKLDHPNILRLHECFETTDNLFLILELCNGGELLAKLNDQPNHCFSEKTARKLIHDMLGAVRYCHDHHIVHRDLKLENFLFENRSSTSELKLIDFGLSCYFNPNDSLHDAVGTPYYVAPEVLSKNYNEKCDMWSIGVMAYMLLSGAPPFYGADDNAVLKVVKTGKFLFHPNIFDSISAASKDFISKCLVKNPESRISAAEAQKHAWFTSGEVNAEPVSPDIVRKLRGFVDRKPLSRLFMEVLSHTLTTGDNLNEIRREFAKIDKDESGEISYEDLRQALLRQGSSISEADMMVLYDTMDVEHMGKIRYHEFIASVIDMNVIKEENLRVAFDKLSHHSEFITVADIRDLLGKDATPEEMNRLLDNYMGPSSRLTYTDFKDIVKENYCSNNNISNSNSYDCENNTRRSLSPMLRRSQSEDTGTARVLGRSTISTKVPSTIRLPSIKETKNDQTPYSRKNSRSSTKNSTASTSSKGSSKIIPEPKRSNLFQYPTTTTTPTPTPPTIPSLTSSTTRIYSTVTKEQSLRAIKSEQNSVNNHSYLNKSTSYRHYKLTPSTTTTTSSQPYLIKTMDPSSIAPSPSEHTEPRKDDISNLTINSNSKILPIESDVGITNKLHRFSLLATATVTATGSNSSYQSPFSPSINTILPSPISPKSTTKTTSIFSRFANVGHFPVPFHTKK